MRPSKSQFKWACVVLAGVTLVGCAATRPNQTTRLALDDFDQMAQAMADSLKTSPAVTQRDPTDDPWLVSMAPLQNLTSEIVTESEKWAVLNELRSAAPIRTLWDGYAIRFVIPPERRSMVVADSGSDWDFARFGEAREATHVLTGTVRAIVRAGPAVRTDLYQAEFVLVDLKSGEPVWTDLFTIKRTAEGRLWD